MYYIVYYKMSICMCICCFDVIIINNNLIFILIRIMYTCIVCKYT